MAQLQLSPKSATCHALLLVSHEGVQYMTDYSILFHTLSLVSHEGIQYVTDYPIVFHALLLVIDEGIWYVNIQSHDTTNHQSQWKRQVSRV